MLKRLLLTLLPALAPAAQVVFNSTDVTTYSMVTVDNGS
jgi:hypothetical protein